MAGRYDKQVFKQLEEVMKKCDSLSQEMKVMKIAHQEEVNALKEEIKNKDKKIENLENEVDRLKKIINNDSSNSSNPPSSDIKPNKKVVNNREKTGKKVGGQLGHKPYILAKKYVEEEIENKVFEHKIETHGKVSKAKKFKSKYILDLNVSVVATEHRFYPNEDGKYNIPAEFTSDVQYGSRLKAFCTSLNVEGCMPLEKVVETITNITEGKIKLSSGSVVNFVNECSKKSEYIRDEIKDEVLNSEFMHTDATVARCDSKNQSARNYSTPNATLLVGTETKSKKALEDTGILNNYIGNLIHDHETVIYNYGNKHAECNVHILRYLKGNGEATGNTWESNMINYLCDLNNVRKGLIEKGENGFSSQKIDEYFDKYDEILNCGFKENSEVKSKYLRDEEKKLLNRMKKYKENHLLFIKDFTIPFDNNLSERELRHVKSKLKVAGCFRATKGMDVYLNIKSILITFKKRGINAYDAIKNIFNNTPVKI